MWLLSLVIGRFRFSGFSAMLIFSMLHIPSFSTPSIQAAKQTDSMIGAKQTDCFNVSGLKVQCVDTIIKEDGMKISLEESKIIKIQEEATTTGYNDYNYNGNYGDGDYDGDNYQYEEGQYKGDNYHSGDYDYNKDNYNTRDYDYNKDNYEYTTGDHDYNYDYYNHESTTKPDKQNGPSRLHKKVFEQNDKFEVDYPTVVALSSLPQHCISTEFPNKLQQVLNDKGDLLSPSELHPIFYGCFDWHSSVHGHWLLARALALFPSTELAENVTSILNIQLTEDKVVQEREYFDRPGAASFERTYGWAWLLKLQEELLKLGKSQEESTEKLDKTSETDWHSALVVLSEHISSSYKQFLPKLVYPIRVGEHTNTAFGLSLALDYAKTVEDRDLQNLIIHNATAFYKEDRKCPLDWEPSGYDFLSPCLQEADLMSRVMEDDMEFSNWLQQFLPQLFDPDFILEPGQVVDRTDGKLVHLDGLNFSRAWCLYSVSARLTGDTRARLILMGDNHIETSRDAVVGSNYMGSHWLATFLLYALEKRKETIDSFKQ